jgi:hypothetical protein
MPGTESLRRGWRELAIAAAQWTLGRPSLYGLPSHLPGLHLGEMMYHPAREPEPLAAAAAVLVRRALELAPNELATRRRNAAVLRLALGDAPQMTAVRPIDGALAGYLRFPVRCHDRHAVAPRLGILRGYPRTMFEQDELRPCLHADEVEHAGARELRRTLVTLPTHSRLTSRDLTTLVTWLRGGTRARVVHSHPSPTIADHPA